MIIIIINHQEANISHVEVQTLNVQYTSKYLLVYCTFSVLLFLVHLFIGQLYMYMLFFYLAMTIQEGRNVIMF